LGVDLSLCVYLGFIFCVFFHVSLGHYPPNPRDASYARVLAVVVCLCISVCVCLSHAGIASKRLNAGSRKQRHVIAQTCHKASSFLTPTVVGWRPPFPLKFARTVTNHLP